MARYRTVIAVWLALLALLAVTCGSAWIRLGGWNTAINGLVSVMKSLLVIGFFMHWRAASRAVRLCLVVAVLIGSLLFILSGADYLTRQIHRAPLEPPASR
jgi:cytochrome c oxidase subunit 4